MHTPSTWYETPLRRLSGGEGRRRAQPTADFATEESTRPRVDPYLSGLAHALALGAGRVPLIP